MLKSYRKNMQASLQRNSDLLSDRVLDQSELPTILDAFFRINAHGELINATHLENICLIAEHNPHCNVAVWTKRKDIVSRTFANRAKPSNLILIWSNPKVDAVVYDPPKHFDRVFNNVSYEHKPDEQNCTGQKCRDCLLCYKLDTTKVISRSCQAERPHYQSSLTSPTPKAKQGHAALSTGQAAPGPDEPAARTERVEP
jgi:hypothetical protein